MTKRNQEETHAGLHNPLTCEAWLTTEQSEESFSWRESFLAATWRKGRAEGLAAHWNRDKQPGRRQTARVNQPRKMSRSQLRTHIQFLHIHSNLQPFTLGLTLGFFFSHVETFYAPNWISARKSSDGRLSFCWRNL